MDDGRRGEGVAYKIRAIKAAVTQGRRGRASARRTEGVEAGVRRGARAWWCRGP